MAQVWLSAWRSSCVPILWARVTLGPTVRMVQHSRWGCHQLGLWWQPSEWRALSPGLCLTSLWSIVPMDNFVSKLEALVLLGQVLCPPLGQRVFPKLPLLSSGNFSAGTHQGSHRSWHFHMVIHGTTWLFLLKVRSPWPSSRGRAMGRLYCGRQSSVPSGTEGTSDWVGDSWCLQWRKRKLGSRAGPTQAQLQCVTSCRIL